MSDNIEKEEKTEEQTESDSLSEERVVYELGYHIVSSVGEEKIPEKVTQIKSLIEKEGGIFIMEEFPKVMRLAYTLVRGMGGRREKHDTTYFGWVKFDLARGTIDKIKRELDEDLDVLRFLIIRTVREDTRVGKLVSSVRAEGEEVKKIVSTPIKKEEVKTKPSVSDAELDRTIDELVVE